jgi:hypothetical protein
MKYGIELLVEQPGDGPAVERHESYRIRVKMWLNRGDLVRWEHPWGLLRMHTSKTMARHWLRTCGWIGSP